MQEDSVALGAGAPAAINDTGAYAAYVPHDLKYNGEFEDCLMEIVLNTSQQAGGIRIIPQDSDETPVDAISVRAADIVHSDLPMVSEGELPLRLSDPRRVYASAVPGIKLSHPAGYLEGGPGLDPDMDTFSDDFLGSRPGISSQEQLRQAVDQEIENSLQLLRQRMQARQRAKEKNEIIEKDLRSLVDQHSMELKIQRRMLEEHKAKIEAKEKRKREREGR